MSEAKHTPAPWKLDGGAGKKGELYVWSDRDEKGKGYIGTHEICVAVVQPKARCEGGALFAEEEIEANARLIAAAPCLLEACRFALESFGDTDILTDAPAIVALRKAIAKAKGNQ